MMALGDFILVKWSPVILILKLLTAYYKTF